MQSNDCSICLNSAAPRGGVPLVCPGCCGKWFHQLCIDEMKARGDNKCPLCRQDFVPLSVPVPPPPHAPPPSPMLRQQQAHNISRRSSSSSERTRTAEDTTEEPALPYEPHSPTNPSTTTSSEIIDEFESNKQLMTLSCIPERSHISTSTIPEFHTKISLKFNPKEDTSHSSLPLDVLCILDNSGSMDGSKMQSLKVAMNFVIGALQQTDRLTVVSFNSSATSHHGLIRMTPDNKTRARDIINGVRAGGGTDIYAGMRVGWNNCRNRNTHNPATSVFLLTDGQDGSNLEQKKALARDIKASGASFFVFGFGADHDSNHLNTIANAAEGSFIYVDNDNAVTDAFGGALGSQQGQSLRNIVLTLRGASPGVSILQTHAGSYTVTPSPDGSFAVSYNNLFGGEFRDVLVKISLPSSTISPDFPLITTSVCFQTHTSPEIVESDPVISTVVRMDSSSLAALPEEQRAVDLSVDAQINRIASTAAMERALQLGDQGNFPEAQRVIDTAIANLRASASFIAKDMISEGLMDDLEEAKSLLTNRSEYHSGRANIMESCSIQSAQRTVYSKASPSNMVFSISSSRSGGGGGGVSSGPPKVKRSMAAYQNKSSLSMQEEALCYRSPVPNPTPTPVSVPVPVPVPSPTPPPPPPSPTPAPERRPSGILATFTSLFSSTPSSK